MKSAIPYPNGAWPAAPRLWIVVVSLLFLLLQAPPHAAAQGSAFPDWRFGVIEAYEAPEQADLLGAAWTRVTFNWAATQPSGPESWTPGVSEEQVQAEAARGRLVVGLLIGIPDWARDASGLPNGLYAPPDDPTNLWATFVRHMIARYGQAIDHWVVWNEPDIWEQTAPGHTWNGSVQDFARLQQITYLVAKERNAEAVVHLPALTYYWDANYGREQYLARLLDALLALPQATEHNAYFDVATAHLYFQPHSVYEIIRVFRQILSERGLHQALWLVETNAPPSRDPTWPVTDVTLEVTLDEQAAYMPQALAAGLAGGAERIAVYKLKDVPEDRQANPEPFGLVRLDGSRRRAFATYQTAVRYFAGVQTAERTRWDAVGQFQLDQSAFTTTVLFSRLPRAQRATVPATADTALLVDMWGNSRLLTAIDGVYDLTLPAALCTQSIGDYCMIGGTTYFLVQAAPGEEIPQGWPVQQFSPTATALPTAAMTPTSTSTATAAAQPTAASSPSPTPSATRPVAMAPEVRESDIAPAAALQAPLNEAQVTFPDSVTFRLQLPPEVEASEVTLHYDVARRSCVQAGSQVPVAPDGAPAGETVQWTWVMSRSGNPPPGTEVWWEWAVTDASGNTWRTPRQTVTLRDERFAWRSVSADGIRLHWYEGEEVGPLLLDAAESGLRRLEQDMGIVLQEDVTFYIYGSAADMRQAVLFVQDWAGGVAFSPYNTILIGVPPSIAEGWGRETVRHELAHLVTGQFGWSCLGGSRPTWLEEGLAMYAEGPADAETEADLQRGIEENAFLPLRSLAGAFPAHDSEAGLAYSQSYSVVAFLLETYGAERLQELILTLAQSLGTDEALETVYGVNTDGLEAAWRDAIGAPARQIPPTPTPLVAAAIPTVPPLSGAQAQATPPAAAQPAPAGSALPLCGLGWAPLFLLGVGVIVWRRRALI